VLLPLLILAVVGLLAMLDAGLRRLGLYTSTLFTWPAGGRPIPPRGGHSSPYRENASGHWILVVEAGIPRAVQKRALGDAIDQMYAQSPKDQLGRVKRSSR
jgi:hypothetical protein